MRVLFLCLQNSARSQMAEALLKTRRGDCEVHSAGLQPGKDVNPHAVGVMRELGYDLSTHQPKHVSTFRDIKFDFVVKMDVPESDIANAVAAKWIESWNIPDPAQGGLEQFRKVRDLLNERIEATFLKRAA
jgi:arsenate reductase